MSDDTQKPVRPTEEEILARMDSDERKQQLRDRVREWEVQAALRPPGDHLPPETHPYVKYFLTKKRLEEERGLTPSEGERERTPEEQALFEDAVLWDAQHGVPGSRASSPETPNPLLSQYRSEGSEGSRDDG